MGIATGTFQLLLQEHRTRPFRGRMLTLGRQDIYLTAADSRYWTSYYGVPCAGAGEPELAPKPQAASRGFVSDRGLFSMLGVELESLDASSYEGCDHVADLNEPEPPASLRGRYDLVLDTGTFEHVFHLPNAFRFCHALLKPGGRMIHMAPLNNFADHGFYMMSPTLFSDFYEANGWRLLQIKVVRHSRNHDSEPYWATDYSPEHFAILSFGGLSSDLHQTFVVAERQQGATATRIPQQRMYRERVWRTAPRPGQTQGGEIDIAGRVRERLAQSGNWIRALGRSHGETRVAVFGAGQHTAILLGVWRESGLSAPQVVMQSTPPAASSFEGIPLVGVDAMVKQPPHLIVLSSHRHELEMAATCERLFPTVPTLRIWS